MVPHEIQAEPIRQGRSATPLVDLHWFRYAVASLLFVLLPIIGLPLAIYAFREEAKISDGTLAGKLLIWFSIAINCALLALITARLYAIWSETRGEQLLAEQIGKVYSACQGPRPSEVLTIRGKALVWDRRAGRPSKAQQMINQELKPTSADREITVFIVVRSPSADTIPLDALARCS